MPQFTIGGHDEGLMQVKKEAVQCSLLVKNHDMKDISYKAFRQKYEVCSIVKSSCMKDLEKTREALNTSDVCNSDIFKQGKNTMERKRELI